MRSLTSETCCQSTRPPQALAKLFADDDDVTLVLEALAQEMTGPEIQDDLGISKTEYETIMKRMRRKARAHDQQGGCHV